MKFSDCSGNAKSKLGSGGEGFLLEIVAYLRPSKGKQILSFVSVPTAVAFEQVLTCCSVGLCDFVVIAVLLITLQCYTSHGTQIMAAVPTNIIFRFTQPEHV